MQFSYKSIPCNSTQEFQTQGIDCTSHLDKLLLSEVSHLLSNTSMHEMSVRPDLGAWWFGADSSQ